HGRKASAHFLHDRTEVAAGNVGSYINPSRRVLPAYSIRRRHKAQICHLTQAYSFARDRRIDLQVRDVVKIPARLWLAPDDDIVGATCPEDIAHFLARYPGRGSSPHIARLDSVFSRPLQVHFDLELGNIAD